MHSTLNRAPHSARPHHTKLSAGIAEVARVDDGQGPQPTLRVDERSSAGLQAIARGEPPLQARKQIDAGLLSSLSPAHTGRDAGPARPTARSRGNILLYVIILAGALAISVIVNIFLAAEAVEPETENREPETQTLIQNVAGAFSGDPKGSLGAAAS